MCFNQHDETVAEHKNVDNALLSIMRMMDSPVIWMSAVPMPMKKWSRRLKSPIDQPLFEMKLT